VILTVPHCTQHLSPEKLFGGFLQPDESIIDACRVLVKTTAFSWQTLEPGNSLGNNADSSTTTLLALSKSSCAEQSPLTATHEQDIRVKSRSVLVLQVLPTEPRFDSNPIQNGTKATEPAKQEQKTWHKFERAPIVRPEVTNQQAIVASAFSKKSTSSASIQKAKESSVASNSNTITKVKHTTAKSKSRLRNLVPLPRQRQNQ